MTEPDGSLSPQGGFRRGFVPGALGFLLASAGAIVAATLATGSFPIPPSVAQIVKLGAAYLAGAVGAPVSATVPIMSGEMALRAPLTLGTLGLVVFAVALTRRMGRPAAMGAVTIFSLAAAAFAAVVGTAPPSLRVAPMIVVGDIAPSAAGVFIRSMILLTCVVVISGGRLGAIRVGAWRGAAVTVLLTGILLPMVLPAEPAYSDAVFAGFRAGSMQDLSPGLHNALVYPTEVAAVTNVVLGGCVRGDAIVDAEGHAYEVCAPWRGTSRPASLTSLDDLVDLPSFPAPPMSYVFLVIGPLVGFGFGGAVAARKARALAWKARVGRGAMAGLLGGAVVAALGMFGRVAATLQLSGFLGSQDVAVEGSVGTTAHLAPVLVAGVFGALGAALAALASGEDAAHEDADARHGRQYHPRRGADQQIGGIDEGRSQG